MSFVLLKIVLTIVIGIGALSPVYSMKYIYPKRLTPQVKVAAEFLSLGNIGIIAEYWNSYINSCSDPDKIIATPHDKYDVKNPDFIEKVFRQPKLYIIKDMWMKTFPDTIHPFGRALLKKGDAFTIANSNVCEYIIISKEKSIEWISSHKKPHSTENKHLKPVSFNSHFPPLVCKFFQNKSLPISRKAYPY